MTLSKHCFKAQWLLYLPPGFNTHKSYVLPTQLYLCFLCGSQNKQPLFPSKALTDWFL